jgi:hypothetical protein
MRAPKDIPRFGVLRSFVGVAVFSRYTILLVVVVPCKCRTYFTLCS